MALVTAGAPAISSAHGPGPVTSLTFLDRPLTLLFCFCWFRRPSLILCRCNSDFLRLPESHIHIDYVLRSCKK